MSDTFQAQSMRLVGYFPAGAIHAQNYQVADIPATLLTHVIYAFANVTATGDSSPRARRTTPSISLNCSNSKQISRSSSC